MALVFAGWVLATVMQLGAAADSAKVNKRGSSDKNMLGRMYTDARGRVVGDGVLRCDDVGGV